MAVSQTLKLYQGAQDAAANTSKLRILWKSTQSGESRNNNIRTANYWISVNGGTEQKYSVNYTLPKGKTQTILDTIITVPHDDLGRCTVAVRTWMDTKISAGVIEEFESIDLTPIPRANTIAAGDAYIGEDMQISVVRKSSSYLHDILYSFQGITGKIAEKSAASDYDFHIPDNWDMEMTKSKTATITLTCITYAGDTEIGRSTARALIKTDDTFAPQLTADVVDINPATIALTGNSKRLVGGASTARVTLNATAQRGATIVSTKINGVEASALEIPNVRGSVFRVSAVDSRGWVTEQQIRTIGVAYTPLSALVEYSRGAQGSDALTVTIKGNYSPGSFGKESNSLSVQHKADSGAWQTVTPTISGNTYTATISLSLDYQTAHVLHFRIADKLTTLTPSQNIPRAVPQTMEGEGWIRHNVPVYQVCPLFFSDTASDESAFEAWLDGLLDNMPNLSTMQIAWKCYPALGQAAAYGTLSRHTSANYAVLQGAAYDDNFYIKQKQGVWKPTRRLVVE